MKPTAVLPIVETKYKVGVLNEFLRSNFFHVHDENLDFVKEQLRAKINLIISGDWKVDKKRINMVELLNSYDYYVKLVFVSQHVKEDRELCSYEENLLNKLHIEANSLGYRVVATC